VQPVSFFIGGGLSESTSAWVMQICEVNVWAVGIATPAFFICAMASGGICILGMFMVVETFHRPALPFEANAAPGVKSSVADNPIIKFRLLISAPKVKTIREIWHAIRHL